MSAPSEWDVVYQTIELEWRQFAATRVLPPGVFRDHRTKIRAILPAHMDALVMTLTSWLMAMPVKRVEVSYPADWREAVKERFAPKWILARWPVKRTVRVIECDDVWPESSFVPESFGPRHRVVRVDGIGRHENR